MALSLTRAFCRGSKGNEGQLVQAGNIVMQVQAHHKTMRGSKDKDDKRGHSGLQSSQRGKDSQGPEGSIMLRANSGQLEKMNKLIVNELSGDGGQHSDIDIRG